jgi:hypothetical protein
MKSARNGLLIPISHRAVVEKLPRAFRTEQNGQLLERDVITGDVLVSVKKVAPPSPDAFKGVDSLKAAEILAEAPEKTGEEVRKKKVRPKEGASDAAGSEEAFV